MAYSNKNERGMTRRQLLIGGALSALAGATGLAETVAVYNPDFSPFRVLEVDQTGTYHLAYAHTMPDLPHEAEGMVLIHVTDIHGGSVGVTRIDPLSMRMISESINSVVDRHFAVPDSMRTLALTGDYVNQPHEGRMKIYEETPQEDFELILKEVDVIRAENRFAVRGNHDCRVSYSRELAEMLYEHGYRMNTQSGEAVRARGLLLYGLRDYVTDKNVNNGEFYTNPRNQRAVSSILDTREPKVVLTHANSPFDPNVHGISYANTLVISGHTHGCQLPDGGIVMRGGRILAQMRMRQLGFDGKMWESQIAMPDRSKMKDQNPYGSSVLVANGIGDHPHRRSTRLTPHTVQYVTLHRA